MKVGNQKFVTFQNFAQELVKAWVVLLKTTNWHSRYAICQSFVQVLVHPWVALTLKTSNSFPLAPSQSSVSSVTASLHLLRMKIPQLNSLMKKLENSKKTKLSILVSEFQIKTMIHLWISKNHTTLFLSNQKPPGFLLPPFSALLVSLEPAMLPSRKKTKVMKNHSMLKWLE